MPDLFLSYSRKDTDAVRGLFDALTARGKDVWADFDDIPGGSAWREELGSGISQSDTFVYVITPKAAASEYCREEVQQAAELNKRFVPVLLEPVPDGELPTPVAEAQWTSFRDRKFDEAVDALVEVIDTDLELTRAHTRYLVDAQEWDRRGRDASLLLRGTELAAAEDWLARPKEGKAPRATPLQYEFVTASRRAASRRRRTLMAGVAAALVVALVLALVALVQRNDAVDKEHLARSRELVSSAALNLDRDPEQSVVLAARALDAKATPDAEEALREALAASHVRAAARLRGRLTQVRYSPDGRLALAAGGGAAFVFDGRDGRHIRVLREPTQLDNAAAFSPDGRLVATAGDGRDVHLWDAAGGRRIRTLRGRVGRIVDVAFAGGTLTATGANGATEAWDFRSARARPSPGRVPVVITPAGSYLLPQRAPRGALELRPRAGGAIDLMRGGARIAVLRSHGRGTAVYGGHFDSAAFSPDGRRIATGNVQGDVQVWDSRGREVATLAGHSAGVLSLAFSPDGDYLVSASADHTARVWDLATDKAIAVLRARDQDVVAAAFSPDGKSVLTAGGDGRARIWDPFDLPVERDLRVPAHRRVQSLQFAAGGRRVVVDGELKATQVADRGALRRRLAGAHGEFDTLGFSPRADRLATASGDGRLALWDPRAGRRVRDLGRQRGEVSGLYFRPDGKRLLATGTQARVLDTGSGETVARLPLKGPAQLGALSPDGRLAATGGGEGEGPQHALVWPLEGGGPTRELRHDNVMTTLEFGADSRVVLTAAYDGTVRLWDAGSGRELASVPGTAATFGPGSRTVAAAGNEPGRVYRCDFCGDLDALRAEAKRAVTR